MKNTLKEKTLGDFIKSPKGWDRWNYNLVPGYGLDDLPRISVWWKWENGKVVEQEYEFSDLKLVREQESKRKTHK